MAHDKKQLGFGQAARLFYAARYGFATVQPIGEKPSLGLIFGQAFRHEEVEQDAPPQVALKAALDSLGRVIETVEETTLAHTGVSHAPEDIRAVLTAGRSFDVSPAGVASFMTFYTAVKEQGLDLTRPDSYSVQPFGFDQTKRDLQDGVSPLTVFHNHRNAKRFLAGRLNG